MILSSKPLGSNEFSQQGRQQHVKGRPCSYGADSTGIICKLLVSSSDKGEVFAEALSGKVVCLFLFGTQLS